MLPAGDTRLSDSDLGHEGFLYGVEEHIDLKPLTNSPSR